MSKIKLVNNAKSFPRWFSTWVLAFATAVPLAYAAVPKELLDYLTTPIKCGIAIVIFGGGVLLRVIDQGTGDA